MKMLNQVISLRSHAGLEAKILPLGATVISLKVPNRNGGTTDVVLGYDTAADYHTDKNYFGATAGRFANRIAQGRFTLDDKTYQLTRNNGAHSLHGGQKGFHIRLWTVQSQSENAVTLAYLSPDGEEGYPGTVLATAAYQLDGLDLVIDYSATTDQPTIINLTNHSYFNLAGAVAERTILDHTLRIAADFYLPVDSTLIPLGNLGDVTDTAFDLRQAKPLRSSVLDEADPQIRLAGGLDHNFCLRGAKSAQPRWVATLSDPASGRSMEVLTTEPGMQIYTGNGLNGEQLGKDNKKYVQFQGVCLECQGFPDAPSQPMFPSARLDPGQVYQHRTIYRFS